MELSDPQITFEQTPELEFSKFSKSGFYCIDGFPKDDLPCVVVLKPPMRGKYVY